MRTVSMTDDLAVLTAVPQAPVALSPADIGEALEALELVWAEEYVFGYDLDKRVFWAARPGEIGLLYTAPTHDELNSQLVGREVAAR
jgi:hypothetical protein